MPSVVSFPIPPVLGRLRDRPDAAEDGLTGPPVRSAQVPDLRKPRGVRYSPVCVPALAACAVLTGATSLLAISEWAADAPPSVLDRIGARTQPRRNPGQETAPVSAEALLR
ncbi:hypothetical protein GCM10010420_36590 [Streptomyces glaucosporus]|uniref:H repeat-associated protein N-terminal domain-containing protein n=1 Tax=Streptomyces glaucosporus TaxID=284044 RepID=A0ABP5VQ54_9ACTN